METPSLKDKLIGMLGIVFGLVCFLPLVAGERGKLILRAYDLFIVKYSLIIVFINGGLLFIIFGVLIYLGIVVPYYSAYKSKYERAKHNLLLIVLSLPFWVSISIVIFAMGRSSALKLLWIFVLIYIAWILVSSAKILRSSSRSQLRS